MTTTTTQTDTVRHSAINALVDLYYLYIDLVRNAHRADESSDEIDQFYLRGGFKEMIEKYYNLASLNPVEVGNEEQPVTLERMLPRKTVADVVGETEQQLALIKGDLKYYSNVVAAYNTPIPEEVRELVNKGRTLLATRIKRSRSVSELATVNLDSDLLAYENSTLKIGPKEIPIRARTLEDVVLNYMFNHCTVGEWVDRDRVVNWVVDELNDESKTLKSVYDKLAAINIKVKKAIVTEQLLFDTSRDGYVKRNY